MYFEVLQNMECFAGVHLFSSRVANPHETTLDSGNSTQMEFVSAPVSERIERSFLEIARLVAECVNNNIDRVKWVSSFSDLPNLSFSTECHSKIPSWKQQVAVCFSDQDLPGLSDILENRDYSVYATPNLILFIGQILGKGVSREVRIGAQIIPGSDSIKLCAVNLNIKENVLQSLKERYDNIRHLPPSIFEQLRTLKGSWQ